MLKVCLQLESLFYKKRQQQYCNNVTVLTYSNDDTIARECSVKAWYVLSNENVSVPDSQTHTRLVFRSCSSLFQNLEVLTNEPVIFKWIRNWKQFTFRIIDTHGSSTKSPKFPKNINMHFMELLLLTGFIKHIARFCFIYIVIAYQKTFRNFRNGLKN